jgi:hypothetical protein
VVDEPRVGLAVGEIVDEREPGDIDPRMLAADFLPAVGDPTPNGERRPVRERHEELLNAAHRKRKRRLERESTQSDLEHRDRDIAGNLSALQVLHDLDARRLATLLAARLPTLITNQKHGVRSPSVGLRKDRTWGLSRCRLAVRPHS